MSVEKLSVFFPAFNEEANIKKTVTIAVKVLEKLKLKDWEIIVVDDGSVDSTAQIVQDLTSGNRRIKLVSHYHNLGYGAALKTGFQEAKFDWVAFADSDGQFDFAEIEKLLERADQADLVLGYRIKRQDPFSRIVGTWVWNLVAKVILGLPVKDYSCGFKLIKKKIFASVQPLVGEEKVTQIELLVKAKKLGFKIVEVGVNHYPRKFGSPTGANLKVVAKSFLDLFKLWWMLINKLELLAFLTIVALAAFFRFYRLPEFMTFLGDEGRDALVIKKILVEHDFPLLGPPTSIGNIYLGPLYYYLMAVPMAIFWLNPVAAAYQVAVIGVLTVILIYYLAKEWFGSASALVAAFLYSISPVTIIYSRSSWNPNPAPFFALLSILSLYKISQTGNFMWLILTGIALAFAIQMHYLALILIPIVVALWVHQIWYSKFKKIRLKHLIKGTILGLAVFLFLMSPLVIFDLKYNFLNYKAISIFFTNRETTLNLNPLNSLVRVIPIYKDNLIGRYLAAGNQYLSLVLSIIVLIPLVYSLKERWQKKMIYWPYLALGIWLLISLIGLALYKQNIYDHYLGFLNPVPFLLLGAFTSLVFLSKWKWNILLKLTTLLLILVVTFLNLQINPAFVTPQNQLQRTKDIARYVIEKSAGEDFNFALIAKNNYDAAYQFYLSMYGHKPKQVPFEITEQLFVICEDPVCEPIGHPKQEISHFGWAKIADEFEFKGVKVFKLIHNPSGKPPAPKDKR